MDSVTAPDAPAAAPAYTSDIFKTWRVLGPVAPEGGREPAGWVATDAVRTFGLADGDDAWTENPDLIGYHFGTIDDGTAAVPTPLDAGLPPLPIGPGADPNARLNAPDPGDADTNAFVDTVGMFVDAGRKKLAAGRDAPAPAADAAAPAPAGEASPTPPAAPSGATVAP